MANIAEEIYNEYKKPVYNYMYKSTFNSHTAEELTQETFLKAFKYISTFRGESSVKTWLFKIARNTYLNYIREKAGVWEEDIDALTEASKSDVLKDAEEKIIIRKVLKNLPERERTLILLRDFIGFTYQEISKITGLTEGQVRIGLHRGRAKFRELYDRENREG